MINPPATLEASEREGLEKAIAAQSVEAIHGAIESVYDRLFSQERFDDQLVTLLCELLMRDDFISISGAWSAFTLVNTSFDNLSPTQLDALGPYAEHAFARTSDPMMAFLMSEWLGERIHSRNSFEALVRLKSAAGSNVVPFVPHGFEHIVRDSFDPALKREALAQLHAMSASPDPRVRDEVETSMQRLIARGIIDAASREMTRATP